MTFITQNHATESSISINNFIPKIIFFDIDDTLSRDGILAEHNKNTLSQLAKTDIKVVIATGRPLPMLPSDVLTLLDNGVLDAIICMNGQYSYTKDAVISQYPLNDIQSQQIAKICQDAEMIYKFESTTQMAFSENALTDDKLIKFIETNHNYIIDPDFYKSETVYQCSVFFTDDYRMQDINFAEHDLKLVYWTIIGADILPVEASKARGIIDVCKYFAVDAKDSMAFGDGMNDIEMFDLVGFAVAMGDAKAELKKHANYVTGTIEEYGIQTILKKLGSL